MSRLCLKKCQFSLKKCCFEALNLLLWLPWQPCIISKNEGKFQYIVFDPLSENHGFVKICDYAWPYFAWFLHGIALKSSCQPGLCFFRCTHVHLQAPITGLWRLHYFFFHTIKSTGRQIDNLNSVLAVFTAESIPTNR